MFNFFRISTRVDKLEEAFSQLKMEFKFYKDEFEKLEIKALESRKVYGKKLKQLIDKEEKGAKEETENPFNNVILPEP